MTYTLAVVEEGLLDLTRFKTPDPWSLILCPGSTWCADLGSV